jgi:hypothetical protein
MNKAPEAIDTRLSAIEAILAKLHEDHAQVLSMFEETNARYRREVEESSAERSSRRLAINIGVVLRVAAVALLAYLALKLS